MFEQAIAASFEFGDGGGCGWGDEIAGGVEIGFLVLCLFFGQQGQQLLGNDHRFAQGGIERIASRRLGLQIGDTGFEFGDAGKPCLALGVQRGEPLLFPPLLFEPLFLKLLLFRKPLALLFGFLFSLLLLREFGLTLEFLLALPLGLGESSRPHRGFGGAPPLQLCVFGGSSGGGGGGGGFKRLFRGGFGSRRASGKQQCQHCRTCMPLAKRNTRENICHDLAQSRRVLPRHYSHCGSRRNVFMRAGETEFVAPGITSGSEQKSVADSATTPGFAQNDSGGGIILEQVIESMEFRQGIDGAEVHLLQFVAMCRRTLFHSSERKAGLPGIRLWLLALGVLATPVLLCLQFTPLVETRPQLSRAEAVRVEALLLDSVPADPGAPALHELRWNEEELNLLGRHLLSLSRLSPAWAAEVELREGALGFEVSRTLETVVPSYMNLRGEIINQDGQPELDRLWLGYLPVPRLLINWLAPSRSEALASDNLLRAEAARLLSNVDRFSIGRDEIRIELRWDPDLLARAGDQARQWLLSETDRQRVLEYYAVISEVARNIPSAERAIPLSRLLAPLFAEAGRKSLAGSDPIAENQALLQTLAVYVNEEDIAQLVGMASARKAPPAKHVEVRLLRRQDLAQHLTSIAAIAVALGPDLALMLSTAKESHDARHSSGFSFSDLTANSTGVTLARLATRDRESALEMQRRMSELRSDTDYMPAVGNNRDGLNQDDFSELYRDTGSLAYRQRIAEIQLLIESSRVFAGL